MDQVVDTLRDEFSDLPDTAQVTRLLLRLGLAIVLGAAIGYEREVRARPACARTCWSASARRSSSWYRNRPAWMRRA